jgi:hypothetical protein
MNNKKKNGNNNSSLNFIIDICLLVVMALITGIGLLIYLVLVPGREAQVIYGRSVELNFLGLDRHQWGEIHLILGLLLVLLLVLHIFFHWKMIVGLYHKLTGGGKTMGILSIGFLLACLFFILFPLFVTPEVGPSNHRNAHSLSPTEYEKHNSHQSENEIKGYMSLKEVSALLHASPDQLKSALNIPSETDINEKLGQLGRNYGFKPHDVKERLDRYLKK